MRKYAIIGTGAIGAYFAVKLTQANFDVHCLLRSDYEHVKKHGLKLVTQESEFNVTVNAYNNVIEMPICDVILITLKTFDNNILKEIIPKISDKNTKIVLLQNGIDIEEDITSFVDPSKIIGASTGLLVRKISSGIFQHLGYYSVDLASYLPNEKLNVLKITVDDIFLDFEKSGFKCVKYNSLAAMRWKKLVINIPTSGLQVVLDSSMQGIIKNPYSYKLLCSITKEVILIAEKCGEKMPEGYYELRVKVFEDLLKLPPYYNSLKQDFDANRKIEVDSIFGNPIKIAEARGLEMPLTKMLYLQIMYLYEKKLNEK